jgi:hypothetical protein
LIDEIDKNIQLIKKENSVKKRKIFLKLFGNSIWYSDVISFKFKFKYIIIFGTKKSAKVKNIF